MTQATLDDLSLSVSREIAAPREAVFDAWLDPEMLARFMIPAAGMTVPEVTADPKVGGRFTLLMRGEKDYPHEGSYLEIQRPERLVFSWESPFDADGSTVTLTFEEVPAGTKVQLTQLRFPSEESRDSHNSGWTSILENLAGLF